jgi:hypothetical protein
MKSLKNVMLINAFSSGATGVILILFPGIISGIFGISTKLPFVAVGIFLFLFAILVFAQAIRDPIHKGWLKLIIILDIAWVVESAILILAQLFDLSSIGYVLTGAVALWVALMATLQTKGLKQFSSVNA